MGGFVVTSNPLTDRAVLAALEPEPVVTFTDLLERAQATLDLLKESAFFRRYIEEALSKKKAESEAPRCLKLACTHNLMENEANWLIMTEDYKLKFWTETEVNITDYDNRIEPVTSETDTILEQMQTGIATFRTLMILFGEPSFTAEDIMAEMTRNGTIHLIDVLDTGARHRTRHEMNLRRRVHALQFDLTAEVRDYDERFRIPEDGQFIIIMDLDPDNVEEAMRFFNRLTDRQKRHLWTTRNDEGAGTFYRNWGFSMETITFPSVAEAHSLSDTELLGMLSNMFNDQ